MSIVIFVTLLLILFSSFLSETKKRIILPVLVVLVDALAISDYYFFNVFNFTETTIFISCGLSVLAFSPNLFSEKSFLSSLFAKIINLGSVIYFTDFVSSLFLMEVYFLCMLMMNMEIVRSGKTLVLKHIPILSINFFLVTVIYNLRGYTKGEIGNSFFDLSHALGIGGNEGLMLILGLFILYSIVSKISLVSTLSNVLVTKKIENLVLELGLYFIVRDIYHSKFILFFEKDMLNKLNVALPLFVCLILLLKKKIFNEDIWRSSVFIILYSSLLSESLPLLMLLSAIIVLVFSKWIFDSKVRIKEFRELYLLSVFSFSITLFFITLVDYELEVKTHLAMPVIIIIWRMINSINVRKILNLREDVV